MKKKLCSFLLMLLTLACVLAVPALAANANAKAPLDLTFNTGSKRAADSDLFRTAYVRNKGASTGVDGTAKQIEVVVDLTGLGSSTNSVFAVVMRASDYESLLNNGPGPGDVNATSYYNLAVADRKYYAAGRRNLATAEDGKLVIPMADPSAANDGILANDTGSVASKDLEVPTPVGTNYYHEYVLFVFGEKTGAADGADLNLHYYIDRFYMDAKGYVYTPSYMIRYNANNPNVRPTSYSVGSLPDTQVQRAAWNDADLGTGDPGNATLSGNTPTRTGYKFLGWTTEPKTPLAADATLTLPMEGFYEKSAVFNQPVTLNTVYDLYAYWQVVPVQFAAGDGTDTDGFKYLNFNDATGNRRYPQFGVAFSTVSSLGQPGDGTSEPGGTKVYTVKTYKDGVPDTNPNTYGLSIAANGNATQQKFRWGITGTPTSHSDGKPVVFEITVKDESNDTTDVIRVNFKKVEKGAQPIPTLDGVTGLKSQIVGEDGQLLGFYASGPVIETDSNKTGYLGYHYATNATNGTEGTGTMTDYYIAKRMIYEYRPKGIDYTNLPNEGWREVPMPSNWYGEAYITGTLRQDFLDSLKLKATKVVTTGYNTSEGRYAPVTVVTNLPEGFADTGWPENYGYIEYDGTLPIIHGLTADADYEIRFRENTNNAVSEAQTITIGGAAGGGGGSGGLAVNLAGGDIKSADADAYAEFVEKCHGMSPGDSIAIPAFIPERENYSFAGWTLDVKDEESHELILYNYNAEAETPVSVMLGDKPTALAAVWNATTGGFSSITFYDWDETTVLGSIVVPKGNATAAVAEFTKTLQAPTSQDVTKNAEDKFWIDDEKFPLTYKKGYSFEGCWLPFESETPTVYGYRVSAFNANQSSTPERPTSEEADFTNVTGNMVVKAAYNQNAELDTSNAANRRYSTEAVSYTRFGTTTNYGITIEVRRENANGAGVPRIISPALRVTLATSAGNLLMMLPLDSTDVASAQVVANAAVTNVTWTLVETYGNKNWVGAGVRAVNSSRGAGTMNVRGSGFLFDSTLSGINDMLEEYTVTNPKVAAIYNYINNNSLTGIGLRLPAGISASDAKDKLLAAWADKNCERDGEGNPVTDESGEKVIKAEKQREGLTFEEMQAALSS